MFTFQSQARCTALCDHWGIVGGTGSGKFQSQARCTALCDRDDLCFLPLNYKFQSQARCTALCDKVLEIFSAQQVKVSISSEMHGPLRHLAQDPLRNWIESFNLKRDARPFATGDCLAPLVERVRAVVCEAQGFLLSVWAASDGSSLLYTISLSFARAWEATLGHPLGFARQRAWDIHHFVPRKTGKQPLHLVSSDTGEAVGRAQAGLAQPHTYKLASFRVAILEACPVLRD